MFYLIATCQPASTCFIDMDMQLHYLFVLHRHRELHNHANRAARQRQLHGNEADSLGREDVHQQPPQQPLPGERGAVAGEVIGSLRRQLLARQGEFCYIMVSASTLISHSCFS